MKLSRKRKTSLAVMGLAVGALLADKVLFAPAEVAADSGPGEYLIAPSDAGGDAQAELELMAAQERTASVGERLRDFAQQHPMDRGALADPFLPPWVDPSPRGGAGQFVATDLDSQEFVRNNRLTAVMGNGPAGYAVIDGSVVRIGQSVGQFTLVAIGERTATFRSREGVIVDLALSGDAPISTIRTGRNNP